MPLKLDLKSGDKLVINGAVVENVGPNAKLLVHNESKILREKEILSVAHTSTPASRVYFSLQCAYMFPQKEDEYLTLFRNFLTEYVTACPSAAPIAEDILSNIGQGGLYRALKATQKLIQHEAKLVQTLQDTVKSESSSPDDA